MSRFVPNNLVQECIANNDIRGLKGAFVAIIFSDRSFSSGNFENTLDYVCRETNLNILESFDNGELLSKKIVSGSITEDDFEEAVYNLKVNFCKERIDDVKKLGKVLYGRNVESEVAVSSISRVPTSNGGNSQGKKPQGHQKKKLETKKSNIGVLLAVGTVAAIAVAVGIAIKSMK